MARETDFLDLYKILGVSPDCELAEFKRAYRRRVTVLHPDRRAHGPTDIIAAERLQRLTALYGAAMIFQRQHGRLPGAARARPVRTHVDTHLRSPVASAPRKGSRQLLLLLVVSLAGWLLWNPSSDRNADQSPVASPVTTPAAVNAAPFMASSTVIDIGTDADVVRQLQGAPILISGDRWDYGPSWILIENHKVADWHSSPVRPLKTARPQP